MKPDTFSERQKFNQWWLWVLLFSGLAYSAWKAYAQIVLGEPQGPHASNHNSFMLAFGINLAVIFLFLAIELKTDLDTSGLRMHFFPFVKKRAGWDEVQEARIVDYGFVGGWGIRLWTRYGTVYNIRGSKGLAITLKSGRKFLVGTQKPETMKQFLENVNLRAPQE